MKIKNELKEVVVTGSRPNYKMEADGLKTSVEKSLLSKLGTANDVLGQLPFLKENDGKIEVFGKGTPLIYVNNKLVRDKNELKQIKSNEIKDVKVILNPGEQYASSVGSIIKITTSRPVGEGLSGSFYTSLAQYRRFNHYENIKLNYRKGGWIFLVAQASIAAIYINTKTIR